MRAFARIFFLKNMIIIRNKSTDPHFNLACEEYLIKTSKEPIFMLWRNKKSVIVGVNQNTAAEVDRDFCDKNGIDVVRRLTGGGAVFHDLGNVNYTYIEDNDGTKFSNYAVFTKDVMDYLKSLGVSAELSGRNDVLVNGKKVIGNAQCVKNGKIMHHGCILYSADMSSLAGALKVNKAKIESKGIKSVSSRVVNIADCLKKPLQTTEFLSGLENFIQKRYNCEIRELTEEEKSEIAELSLKKYSLFEWNYGSSPDYSYEKTEKFPSGLVSVSFNVSSGIISDIKISGDFFGIRDISEVEGLLKGIRHERTALSDALAGIDIDSFIKGLSSADLIKLFF